MSPSVAGRARADSAEERTRTGRAPFLVALLGVAALLAPAPAAAAAAAQAPPAEGCLRCKLTCTLPCSKHRKGAAEMEAESDFCSIAARCPHCVGLFRIDCKDCHGQGEEALLQAVEQQKKRIEEQLAFEKEMGGEPRARIVTAHFDLVFEVEKLTVDRRELDQHELLHLYSRRMEELYTSFNELMGLREADHRCKRFQVLVWRNPLDHRDASLRYAQSGGAGTGVKLLGHKGVYSMLRDRNVHSQDDDLHRALVHNVTHLLLASLFDGVWIGQHKAAWVDAGLAHWFEDRGFGECTNFCYQETNTNTSFRGGKWRSPVRGMVESGKRPSFAETSQKTSNELTTQEHALSFSYVDFLLARDPKLLPKLVKVLQKKLPTRDALREAYGLTMAQFESEWSAWVLETYSKR